MYLGAHEHLLIHFLLFFFSLLLYYSCPTFSSTFTPPPRPPLSPTVNPLYPLSAVHVRGSLIHVLRLVPSPSFLHSPLPTASVCSMFPCFWFYFFISLFRSLDSTCEWGHVIFVFCQPAYFTCPPVPSMLSPKTGILSFCFIVFHCVNVPQFLIHSSADGHLVCF